MWLPQQGGQLQVPALCKATAGPGIAQAASTAGIGEHDGIWKPGDARNCRVPRRKSQPWLRELPGLGSMKGCSFSLLLFTHNVASKGHVSALIALQLF